MQTTEQASLIDARRTLERLSDEHAGYDQQLAAENAVNELLCQSLDRQSYEQECSRINVQPWEDARIQRAQYALTYGDMPEETSRWIEYGLARMRLAGLKAERSQARPAPAPASQGSCTNCGTSVPASVLMHSSRHGPVCPDCYDR